MFTVCTNVVDIAMFKVKKNVLVSKSFIIAILKCLFFPNKNKERDIFFTPPVSHQCRPASGQQRALLLQPFCRRLSFCPEKSYFNIYFYVSLLIQHIPPVSTCTVLSSQLHFFSLLYPNLCSLSDWDYRRCGSAEHTFRGWMFHRIFVHSSPRSSL